mmetsp:Transcript_61201/g.144053  ORF Transcript_61201/g.144053 Transcript_61201/m.144053 type:complete len:244 (+) Transcript_61201:173-904(+)
MALAEMAEAENEQTASQGASGGLGEGTGGFLFKRDTSLQGVESHHAALVRRIIPVIQKTEMKEVAGPRNTKSRFQIYKIECTMPPRGCHPLLQWSIWHRYSDFYRLRNTLAKLSPAIAKIPFPPRRWFAGSCSTWVIKERKRALPKFLELAMAACCSDKEACVFDDFLELKRHDKPPPAALHRRESVELEDMDTLHHNTTNDAEFTKKLRRHDSSQNFKQLKKNSQKKPAEGTAGTATKETAI